MKPVFPIQYEQAGRTYRLQLQEDLTGDSCLGCVFDVDRHCKQPQPDARFSDQREAIEWGCTNYTNMVWKEISQKQEK